MYQRTFICVPNLISIALRCLKKVLLRAHFVSGFIFILCTSVKLIDVLFASFSSIFFVWCTVSLIKFKYVYV